MSLLGDIVRTGAGIVGYTYHHDPGTNPWQGFYPKSDNSGSMVFPTSPAPTSYQVPATPTPLNPNYQAPSSGSSIPGSGGGGSSTGLDPAQIDSLKQSAQQQLDLYNKTYNDAVDSDNQDFGKAQENYNTSLTQLGPKYDQMFDTLNTNKQQSDNQLANQYGARGGTDNSYYQNAVNQQNKVFQNNYSNLSQDKANQLKTLADSLDSAQKQLSLHRESLDLSQFNTLDELNQALTKIGQYNTALTTQRNNIHNALLGYQTQFAASNNPALSQYNADNAQKANIDQISKLAAAGQTPQQIQGYINTAAAGDKDKLKEMLDYYQRAYTPGSLTANNFATPAQ